MSNLFNKLKSGVMDLFGLQKSSGSTQNLFNKAKDFLKGGVNFLKNKNVQQGVNLLSNLTGSNAPRDFFMDAKKYANIGQNLLNGGLNKKLDRSGLPELADRFANRFKKRDGIELQPRRQKEDQFNLSSIFG